jgi:hypothetical protein
VVAVAVERNRRAIRESSRQDPPARWAVEPVRHTPGSDTPAAARTAAGRGTAVGLRTVAAPDMAAARKEAAPDMAAVRQEAGLGTAAARKEAGLGTAAARKEAGTLPVRAEAATEAQRERLASLVAQRPSPAPAAPTDQAAAVAKAAVAAEARKPAAATARAQVAATGLGVRLRVAQKQRQQRREQRPGSFPARAVVAPTAHLVDGDPKGRPSPPSWWGQSGRLAVRSRLRSSSEHQVAVHAYVAPHAS